MNFETLPSLLGFLAAGVTGVVLVVIGLPLCIALFSRTLVRAVQRRQWERAGAALVVLLAVGLLGAGLWTSAVTAAPGILEEPLQMLAMTFLPFTATLTLLALVVQRNAHKKHAVVPGRRAVPASSAR